MKTKLLFTVLLSLNFCLLSSQVPQGINYQAVAGDGSGNPLRNTDLQVKISILSDTIVPVTVWEELHPAIRTNAHGVFSLVVGTGSRQAASTVTNFSDISWTVAQLYIKTQVYYQSSWKSMGSTKLWTVPYSMVAGDLTGAVKKLSVTGNTSSMDEALFEVKNKNGQTVFAVYNEGVRIYVDDGSKGSKGGFSIGGFDITKGSSQQYLYVGGDSIRAYIHDNPLNKGSKGGFSIGGFDITKGQTNDYFVISPDSARVYVSNTPSGKGSKGGFSIGGFDISKGSPARNLMTVSDDSIRMYIGNNGKGSKGGFSIGGFDITKGTNGHFLDVSTDASGIINPSENRILWYPIKNAFLAGKVLIEKPDSVGENSFASGFESKAIGMYSQALGYQSIARGEYSTSIGYQAVANKNNSFAFGQWAMAKNYESYAFGRGAIAGGFRSFAFGSAGVDSAGTTTGVTYAKGDYAFAMGQGSRAFGFSSFAFGTDNLALGDFSQAYGLSSEASGHTSITFGYKTKATGWVAMAIGDETTASGRHSFAGGDGSSASYYSSFAFGHQNLASNANSVAMGQFTKSTGENSFAMGQFSEANGKNSTALGTHNIAEGEGSFAGGGQSKATSGSAFAFGFNTLASEFQSVAMGTRSISSGGSSFAMGDSAVAKGYSSIALGSRTLAEGYISMATGEKTVASGLNSFAGGWKSNATAHHSFAFGSKAIASGSGSTVFGTDSKASGGEAFSAGNFTRANVWNSATFGNGTISNSYSAFVLGRFNDTTNMLKVSTDPIFVIGIGTSNSDRKNALTVLQNSNVGINMVNPQYILDIAGGSARVESGYSWLTSSDVRYKKNISTLESSLNDVMAMRGVRFDLINDNSDPETAGKNIGFIAQELEQIVPEVVVTGPDGYKSVAYDKLTALLTEAIKEQQKEIEELRNLVNILMQNQKLQNENRTQK